MIPVLSVADLRAADAQTIAREPIASIDLMERAATRFTERVIHHHRAHRFGDPTTVRYVVVVGMGNNGGDGLVVARLLHHSGIPLRVVRVLHSPEPSADNRVNYQLLKGTGVDVAEITAAEGGVEIHDNEVVIDAIFGTGLNKPLTGLAASAVERINASSRPVIALDIPSGLFAEDNATNDPKHIVRATLTITFEVPKLAFLLAENAAFVGDWEVVPIGLDPHFLRECPVSHQLVQRDDGMGLLRPKPRFAHKGTFGHALIVAGGSGHYGAAVLATRAALRSGAGLVTAHVPRGCVPVVHAAAPEAMCSVDMAEQGVTHLPALAGYSSVGIGPGLGVSDDTSSVVKRLIQDAQAALVIDADGLNVLAENPTWLAFLPPSTILTPHPKEFDRLVGATSRTGYERLESARQFAIKNKCIVVLKGAWTATCAPSGNVYFNPTGNPGMAKGGSGDVLTGLLSGILAQGYSPLHAAILGAYLHGSAGDIAARTLGMDGMKAGDIIEALPMAWQDLRRGSEEPVQ